MTRNLQRDQDDHYNKVKCLGMACRLTKLSLFFFFPDVYSHMNSVFQVFMTSIAVSQAALYPHDPHSRYVMVCLFSGIQLDPTSMIGIANDFLPFDKYNHI
jgi:hypothetical protein